MTQVMTILRTVPVIPPLHTILHKRAVIMALLSKIAYIIDILSHYSVRYLQDDSSESSEDERRFIRSTKVIS